MAEITVRTEYMCDKQTSNIEAVYDFWQACSQKTINTNIVVKAKVNYFDKQTKAWLYRSAAFDDILIDTVADDKISISSLPECCFCEFTTKFQDMRYDEDTRSLIVEGKGYQGSGKHDYILTLVAS